ncbi:winged helix-turn-helix transcriptional regulator [Streptomyces melanosporofaciens]|uniref:winged helix-turn-helix transcriptional regulator n=1 Tax=Streptomyces melanosporofaciens TaxID=67327 RepID=UPI0031387B80
MTEKVLIGALKELEADDIIVRKDFREVPPHVEYSLTPFGVSLDEALRPLCEWGYVHMGRDHPYSQADHPSKLPQERTVDLPRGATRLTVISSRAAKFSAIERRQANCRTPEFSNSPMLRMSGVIPR